MSQPAAASPRPTTTARNGTLGGVAGVAGRYGLSAFGPMSIAAAHFIAALVFLRALPPAEFGLISFVFVAVPPFLSVTMSLIGASLYTTAYRQEVAQAAQALHLKGNLSVSLGAIAVLTLLMLAVGAGWVSALLFGAYGGLMSLRQFARCFAYVENRQVAVAASDGTYSALLLLAVGLMAVTHVFSIPLVAGVLAGAALVALLPFGTAYLHRQFTAGFTGWVGAYRAIWRDLARWSLLGVVTTEMTANAHAYIVTLIAGPEAFALLAAGALFLRPVSLFLSALPDLERASMAKGIVNGDLGAATRSATRFRIVTALVWVATIALTSIVLNYFPDLLPQRHYDPYDVAIVITIWASIMAVRIIRTPDGVLLQAAAEFRPLAMASVASGVVSLVLTLVLLFLFGPIASLLGILVGDIVMAVRVRLLLHEWVRRHG